MRDIVKLGCILMTYTLVVGIALAAVNIKTMPRIEANKAAAENAARTKVLPDMAGEYEKKNDGSDLSYWIGYIDKEKTEIGGFIFTAKGTGYSSTIEIMVGVDIHGKIAGVKILSQQETPGLGAKAVEIHRGESEPWFTRQFKGKSVEDDIKVTKDGGNIDAITGATITSRTITTSINTGLVTLKDIVGGQL